MLGYATVFFALGMILGTISTILTWFMYKKTKETSTLSVYNVKTRKHPATFLIPLVILILFIAYFVFILYFMIIR